MLISLKKYKKIKIKNKKIAYTYLMLLEIPIKESTKEKTKRQYFIKEVIKIK